MELGKVVNRVTKFVQERVPFPLGEEIHEFVPRDQVWVKDWKHDSLAPHWRVPVLLFQPLLQQLKLQVSLPGSTT